MALPAWLQKGSILRQSIKRLVATVGALVWSLRCYTYIVIWSLSNPAREFVATSGTLLLLVSALLFVVEAVMTWFHLHLFDFDIPIGWKVAIIALAAVLARHHWRSFKAMRRRPIFLTAVRLLLPEAAALGDKSLDQDARARRLADFITKVLLGFRVVFRGLKNAKLNVMFPDKEGRLRIAYCVPPEAAKDYGDDLCLEGGIGGAGKALSSKKTVYIPAIQFRQGILVTLPTSHHQDEHRYELAPDVYVPAGLEPYRSVISSPIRSSTGECLGVLNVDCQVNNPFREFDFQLVEVAAALVGMALDSHRGQA